MKVYLKPDTDSRGINRVVDALIRYLPKGVEAVETPQEADFEIIHVWGRHDTVERRIEALERAKKPFAMIQYVLKSSMRPDAADWLDMWYKAKVVWSYYDLMQICVNEGMYEENGECITPPEFNFYHAPLGVDSEVFIDQFFDRKFIIGASSQHALSEGARECAFAAKEVKKQMFFLGHELRRGHDIVCRQDLPDKRVANFWSMCTFISGLRRVEGFELPVIEGALCGARPIVFDRPEMRKWFGEFAIFIPEGPREQVIKSLANIFSVDGVMEINEPTKQLIRDRFNWETILKGFWEKIL